ncbi:hypothetical protein [Myceligenerans pegani]|uniref:Uncharacterized protein n=1 Tax=Myceligenerans pegani TaxID=2776917 RepID=A0ABR9MUF5_9MICO|nr:hypothetical protein [Myceligenerans sp. TRM 65318]MBE1874402.1 hypothetical protein [Myceligenerans sp. TRM 65318]MBE3016673.1 hypothetical protein [Myceligenerans sp. TRM 65318]
MTRVFALGTIVAIGCGVLLGLTLAYGQWMLAIGALILGVGGATVVALAAPEPEPAMAPVTLGGPVVRPTIELDDEADDALDAAPASGSTSETAPETAPAPVPALLPLDQDRSIPSAA